MRILLVEDHGDTRQILTRLLTHWGYEVIPAENLKHGIAQLDVEPIDVILSDIGLPDGTGYALITEARRRGKNVLAIALTAFGYPTDLQIAKMSGFDHHLSKPFDCQHLRTLLEGASTRERPSHGSSTDPITA